MSELPADLPPGQKAEVLLQALPWLERFAGTRVVVKYGGNAMVDTELQRAFAEDVRFLHQVGMQPIVVHGGGPQISAMLDRLQIASEFRGGLRVTTPEAMAVVRMVLTGQVQRDLVPAPGEAGPDPFDAQVSGVGHHLGGVVGLAVARELALSGGRHDSPLRLDINYDEFRIVASLSYQAAEQPDPAQETEEERMTRELELRLIRHFADQVTLSEQRERQSLRLVFQT